MTRPTLPPPVLPWAGPPATRPAGDRADAPVPATLRAVREEVARVLGQPSQELTPELRLEDDLDVDSVMLIEMKCCLEHRYPELAEVSLADVFLGCGTLGDLADRLAELVGLPVG